MMMHPIQRSGAFLLLAATLTVFRPADLAAAAQADYLDYEGAGAAMKALDQQSAAIALSSLGQSGEGRELHLLTLAADQNKATERPALLIVAGLDGRHRVGTSTAVEVARTIVANHAELLNEVTVYIVPLANPDGLERNLGAVNYGHIGTLRSVDEDRDGASNEDGPQDLNGDGKITMMRRPNPPLDDTATHMADPAEPRLLKKPDPKKGARAMYSIYVEGLDADGDGRVAEDGPGMVDLDRNFMHRYPEHERDAGQYQLSEPEALALAKFVLEHPNIVAAVTYGRHDNLINVPDGRGTEISGRGPKDLDAGDVDYYKEIAKVFTDVTGQQHAPKPPADTAGSFQAWLYAHRGIPSFATVVWGRPEAAKKEEAKNGEGAKEGDAKPQAAEAAPDAKPQAAEAKPPDDPVSGVWNGTITLPDMGDMPFSFNLTLQPDNTVTGTASAMAGNLGLTGQFDPAAQTLALVGQAGDTQMQFDIHIEGDAMTGTTAGPAGEAIEFTATRASGPAAPPEVKPAAQPGTKKDEVKPDDPEAAAWLKYSDDERHGEGFVAWQPFDHPTLGQVEIGGFVPGFQMNPPPDQLEDLGAKQAAFAVEVMNRRPKLKAEGPVVKKLAPGLYEVRFGIVNDGYLPTATSMAGKTRSLHPTIIRISTPIEQIVSGERLGRSWGIDGGERIAQRWILQVPDGSSIDIEIANAQIGNQKITFKAEETK